MSDYRDRVIHELVLQRIMDDCRLAGQAVNVTSNEGYVEITGMVDTDEQKLLVVEVARGVMGVRHVADLLEVREGRVA
jgi:osmotically-inducible protein OsmY